MRHKCCRALYCRIVIVISNRTTLSTQYHCHCSRCTQYSALSIQFHCNCSSDSLSGKLPKRSASLLLSPNGKLPKWSASRPEERPPTARPEEPIWAARGGPRGHARAPIVSALVKSRRLNLTKVRHKHRTSVQRFPSVKPVKVPQPQRKDCGNNDTAPILTQKRAEPD